MPDVMLAVVVVLIVLVQVVQTARRPPRAPSSTSAPAALNLLLQPDLQTETLNMLMKTLALAAAVAALVAGSAFAPEIKIGVTPGPHAQILEVVKEIAARTASRSRSSNSPTMSCRTRR